MSFRNTLTLERIEILIDPDDLSYKLDMNLVNIGHLYAVCQDIVRRIEEADLGEDVTFTEEESGRELTADEIRKQLKGS